MEGQNRRERRRGARRLGRSRLWMWFIVVGVGLGLMGVVLGLITMSGGGGGGGRFPQVGEHWHADYTIVICGETLPDFPYSVGGIHTHGDGIIHMHPTYPAEAGRNAHLARFIASTGGRLTDTSLKLPSGKEYTNGDPCPDGGVGQVVLLVNGEPVSPIASYVPRNGEGIKLGFEPQ